MRVGNGRHAPSLIDLLSRLFNELGQLLDQKLALFKVELKDQLTSAGRNALLLVIGGVVAGLGILFLGIALAFWLGEILGTVARGFALVGGAVLLVGSAVLLTGSQKWRRQRFVPERTVQELRRDAEWIRNEL
ncbi:MAG: phage holin family protein [Candidatus Rokuibacteriota bacterium]